jgi:hypothetical protein
VKTKSFAFHLTVPIQCNGPLQQFTEEFRKFNFATTEGLHWPVQKKLAKALTKVLEPLASKNEQSCSVQIGKKRMV